MSGDWTTVMLEGLLEARAGGISDFARAWRYARRRSDARGVRRPRDFTRRPPDEGEDWLPFSSFFRRACEREWSGRVHGDLAGVREQLLDPATDGPQRSARNVLLA